MDADAPTKASLDGNSTSDSVKDWVASLLNYFHLRIRLLGIEGKEAGIHLLIIGGLVVAALAMLAGATVMMGIFILFLICLLFHLDWGWAALLTAADAQQQEDGGGAQSETGAPGSAGGLGRTHGRLVAWVWCSGPEPSPSITQICV